MKRIAQYREFSPKYKSWFHLVPDYKTYLEEMRLFLTQLGPDNIISVDHQGGGRQTPHCIIWYWQNE